MEKRIKITILPTQFKTPTKEKVKLFWTFQSLMMVSPETIKMDYSIIKNMILSYKKVYSEIIDKHEKFLLKDKELAKLTTDGKQLYLYLNLNPKDYCKEMYNYINVDDSKTNKSTPMLLVIRNKVGIKKAVELIDFVMQNEKLLKLENNKLIDYTECYPSYTVDELIEHNLIKYTM